MQQTPQTLAANGVSPWVGANPWLVHPGVGLMVSLSADANLTAALQYTYDSLQQPFLPVALSRAATVLTITLAQHGLAVGDSVFLANPQSDPNNTWFGMPGSVTTGWYTVAGITDENDFTVTVANAGAAAATGFIQTFAVLTHPTLQNLTGAGTREDSGFSWMIGAYRLSVANWVAGFATLRSQQSQGT